MVATSHEPVWECDAQVVAEIFVNDDGAASTRLSAAEALSTGLRSDQVERRRAKYGLNELEKPPSTPIWKLVLEQFDLLMELFRRT